MATVIGSANSLSISVAQICEFYKKNWQRQIALSDEKFYKWQFVNNPTNKGLDDCCVALDDGELVGVMGLNGRDFFLNGARVKGAELTTWVVSESSRNKGAGPKMIAYLKENYDVMVGMGISLAALPVYLRSGFRYVKSIPRYVHVINWDAVSPFVETQPLAKKYAKEQMSLTSFQATETTKESISDISSRFHKYFNCFSRGEQDLSWRYDEHPYFDYVHFIVNGSCFVSMRIDRNIDGFVMAHCVDIFGDTKHYDAAISAAVSFAKDNGADAVDFFCTNSALSATLSSMGFFSTLDHDFFKFPHLFHPVEIRNPATTSLILWAKDEMSSLLDTSRLHITKQDADFDRPTIHGMKK